MVLRFLSQTLFSVLIGIGIFLSYQYARNALESRVSDQGEGRVLPARAVEQELHIDFRLLAVQSDDASGDRQVLACTQRLCERVDIPPSAGRESFFDGTAWYMYQHGHEKDSLSRALVRLQEAPQNQETVVEETALVRPRGVYLSPTGSQVAYWLDDISSQKQDVTELWMYDSDQAHTKLLVEKLVRNDLLTSLRWNSAGTVLWFLADSGVGDEQRIEFVTIPLSERIPKARFLNIDWSRLQDLADHGLIDINPSGTGVVFVEQEEKFISRFSVAVEGSQQRSQVVRGTIPLVQWLTNESIIYATQNGQECIFWLVTKESHTPLARIEGMLKSGRADPSGSYLSFIMDHSSETQRLYILDISSGRIQTNNMIPTFGERPSIVQFLVTQEPLVKVNELSAQLSDEQLTAFIQRHLGEIASDSLAQPERIVMTSSPNTMLIDFNAADESPQRILVVVNDALHPEWKVLGRYRVASGEWFKVEGSEITDPAPVRRYEWEASVQRWILKDSFLQ